MDIKTTTTFLGWCTVINIGLLILAMFAWMLVNESVSPLAATMLGLTQDELEVAFFDGLMIYRAGIFLLNLVPYVALKIMASSKREG